MQNMFLFFIIIFGIIMIGYTRKWILGALSNLEAWIWIFSILVVGISIGCYNSPRIISFLSMT